MNKSTCTIFLNCCFWGLILAVLFTCCQTKTAPNSTTDAPPEMERLLLAADTLSTEVLTAEARKLPGTWVDTFFQKRLDALILRQDGPALNRFMAVYEKIRPGDEAAGAFINLGRGIAHQYATRFDSAEIHYKLAQDWFQQKGDKQKLIDALTCRASICRHRGKFEETVTLQYQALELAETEKDRMAAKVQIAITLSTAGDTTKPIELLQEPVRFL